MSALVTPRQEQAKRGDIAVPRRRNSIASVLALALATRVVLVAVGAWAGSRLPLPPGGWNRGPAFVSSFARWDSGFYMDIAQKGYGFKPEAWSFEPGYPLAIAGVHALVPILDWPVAGFLVANACFFGCIVLAYKLTARIFDADKAWRAALLVAVVPGTVYLSAVYSDSLFLLLVLGCLLAAHDQRWILAAFLASLATVTRPPGVVLGLSLVIGVLLAWRARGRFPLRALWGIPIAASLPLTFAFYSWRETGDLFINVHAREAFWPNVHWHNPANLLDYSGVALPIKILVDLGMALTLLSLAWMAWDLWRRRRWAAAPVYAFAAAMAIVYLAYSEPNPILRYLLSSIPIYWAGASLARTRAGVLALAACSFAVALAVAAIFCSWGPLY